MNETGENEKPTVLFICAQNSGRSQMAEALLRHLYGDRYEVYSAGVEASTVSPYAIQALAEIGIDMSSHYSKSLDEFADRDFDYVVTVCDKARETCPFFPGRTILHHSFSAADTSGSEAEILREFGRVRDEIRSWIVVQFG